MMPGVPMMHVLYRQLGFSGGVALEDNEYGNGVDPIWLDDVDCSGIESGLSDCRHRGYGDHNCGHYEDAGVQCGKIFNEEFTHLFI